MNNNKLIKFNNNNNNKILIKINVKILVQKMYIK